MSRIALIIVLLAACAGGAESTTTVTGDAGQDSGAPLLGFSLSPATYDETGIESFFEVASDAGDLVAWVGPWQDLDQGANLVYGRADVHHYVPLVITGFPTEGDNRVMPEDAEAFISEIADWVAVHPVPYFGVGVEVNYHLAEKAPEDFEWLVSVFPDVLAEVHEASPDTVVFPVFQLERLRGLKGGLFGEDETEPEWELIDRFPSADAIGFTTYPGLVFTDPEEIPPDYYEELKEHTDKPIVVTELGWQAGGVFGEWSGTPGQQAAFIRDRLPGLAAVAEIVVWSFLHDPDVGESPFATMGLISSDGVERPGLSEWRERADS